MKAGLINLEKSIHNTAYMQISEYYKNMGWEVELLDPSKPLAYETCQRLYCSTLFSFTDRSQVPKRADCGGTGVDVKSKLRPEISNCDLDYSIYPNCKTTILWFSRGCNRKCSFCIVHDKEGDIHSVTPKNLNPKGEYITVQDNNFFAAPLWREAIQWLTDKNQPVAFDGGVDVRILTPEMYHALNTLKHEKQIKIAWDNPFDDLREDIAGMLRYIKAYKIMCYVLIGHNSTRQQDLDRIKALKQLKVDPYVMCMDRTDRYQKAFQRWVNGFAHRETEWKDFTWK